MQAQARLIAGRPPENDRQSIDFHAWFLCTNAMRQVGGQAWVEWYDVTLRVLTELQCEQGSAKGSWDPIDVWGEDGGRVYSTAMATLTLLAPVRYAELATIAPVPDTNEFRRLRSAWLRRNFETVSTELERLENDDDLLSDEDRALVSLASQQLLAERENAARVVDWYRVVPDYLSAETQLEAIAKEFGELAEGVSATKVLADMRREPGSSRELKAAKEYSRVLQKYSGSSLRNGLLNFISKDMYSGTKAQATAAALLQEIRD